MNLILFLVILVCLLLVVVINKEIHFNFSNIPKGKSPQFVTSCSFQPKACPQQGIKCDCQQYCNNNDAKLYKRDGNYYCYIPHYYSGCKQEYGIYKFDKTWKCHPKYKGAFTTSGEQIVGKYPYSRANDINSGVDYNDPSQYNVDCSGLYDENGNKLIKVTLQSGVTFCVKDYCFNNTPNNPARGYNLVTGFCDCTENTQNLDAKDKTSPCVMVSKSDYNLDTFKINCYKEDNYIKDMSNYLIPCSTENNFHTSIDPTIKVVKIYP